MNRLERHSATPFDLTPEQVRFSLGNGMSVGRRIARRASFDRGKATTKPKPLERSRQKDGTARPAATKS